MTVSIPADDDLDVDGIDELVDRGPWTSRSELIRAAIRGLDVEKFFDPQSPPVDDEGELE